MNLSLEGGAQVEASVRSLRVREYPKAFEVWKAGDEAALLALGFESNPKTDPADLVPADYERVAAAFLTANPSFFAWCGRREAAQVLRGALASMTAPGVSPGSTTSPVSRLRPV